MCAEIKQERFVKVPLETPLSELNPLNVQCKTTKCEDHLHCFRLKPNEIRKFGKEGVCYACGSSENIDWHRIKEVNINDSNYVIESLNFELIRKVYWNANVPKDVIDVVQDLGIEKFKEKVMNRMTNNIGCVNPYRNGYTPYTGDLIYYAQHATATCCRRCMEYWYGFKKKDYKLNDAQLHFSSELIFKYISQKIPLLTA